jgi:nucleotide-binding universal stress UspA family protein
MKTIIVPTDFSAISNNAIDYAIDLAKQPAAVSCCFMLTRFLLV